MLLKLPNLLYRLTTSNGATYPSNIYEVWNNTYPFQTSTVQTLKFWMDK